MPARAFVIRFPNGDFEYDFTRRALPRIGDRFKRRGALWQVTSSAQDGGEGIVVVRVSSAQEGKSASMTESTNETQRDEDHRHPLESEDALRESADRIENEEEQGRVPQPGVTADLDDR